ncbi:MAG: hypothetical protein MJE12_02880, partial [Alphaproteobacteria bacterium]|nr:hypothetical protein [Alphaproteobacteria bacterium]
SGEIDQKTQKSVNAARNARPLIRARINELARFIVTAHGSKDAADRKALPSRTLEIMGRYAALRSVNRLLSIHGTATDARELVSHAHEDKKLADALWKPKLYLDPEATNFSLWKWELALAAYIENRLGLLRTGAVQDATKSADREFATTAALYRKFYGHNGAEDALRNYLDEPSDPELALKAAELLLGSAGPQTLVAMRSVVERYEKFVQARKEGKKARTLVGRAWEPAALYLLAHGTRTDWRLVARLGDRMDEIFALKLATLSRDPGPLIDHMMGFVVRPDRRQTLVLFKDYIKHLSALCPVLRGVPATQAASIRNHLHRRWEEMGVKLNLSGRGPASDKLTALAVLVLNESYCRPDVVAAEAVLEQKSDFFEGITWLPKPGFAEGLKKQFYLYKKSEPHMDHLSHDQLKTLLVKKNPYVEDVRDHYLAYHRIANHAPILIRDSYPYGMQRRAFVFRSDKLSGAIIGVAGVRPTLSGNTVRLALSFDIASFGGGTMISGPDAAVKKAVSGGGKDMISEVTLSRGGEFLDLSPAQTASKTELVYTAELKRDDLSNLYLHVTLSALEQEQTLAFDLFAGDYAAELSRMSGIKSP